MTAAAGLAVPATLVATAPPASAGTCASASGVSVVVDFDGVGGGVQSSCVAAGGGQRASSLFPAAGFDLNYVQSQPGFVCRVSGAPASDPCVDTPSADASWALWWSDGTSGQWYYSNYGVGSLKVPDGGYVAFSWQSSSSHSPPGAAAAPHASAPTATPTPTSKPTKAPTRGPTKSPTRSPTKAPTRAPTKAPTKAATPTAGQAASASASSSATGVASPLAGGSESPTAASTSGTPAASSSPSGAASSATESAAGSVAGPSIASATAPPSLGPDVSSDAPSAGGGSALPAWLIVLVLAVLFGAAGVVAVVRRRVRS